MSALSLLRLYLPRVTLAFVFAACGGKTESAANGNGVGGSSTTGGVTSSGGAGNGASGGKLATGGTRSTSGGASGTGGSKPTTGSYGGGEFSSCPDPTEPPICGDDKDCYTGAYCGIQYCARCHALCWMVCAPYQTSSCGATSTALSDQLTGDSCTVIVRANAETLVVTDYAVNCGPLREVSGSSLLNGLLQMNSIDWANAVSITDPTKTGLFVFQVDNGPTQYTDYFSAETGNQLLVTQGEISDAGTDGISFSIAWSPASDLGTTCAPGRETFPFQFGSMSGTSNLNAITAPLVATDLFHIIRTQLGDVQYTAVTELLGSEPEYLFFITAG